MTDEQRKHKRKVYGLRYRMKIKTLSINLTPLFTKMGGVGSLLSVLCVVVSLCENAVTNF